MALATSIICSVLCWVVSSIVIKQMDDQLDDIEALNYDNLEAVARLQSSDRYRNIMQVRLRSDWYDK